MPNTSAYRFGILLEPTHYNWLRAHIAIGLIWLGTLIAGRENISIYKDD